jgi:hypothetical protein
MRSYSFVGGSLDGQIVSEGGTGAAGLSFEKLEELTVKGTVGKTVHAMLPVKNAGERRQTQEYVVLEVTDSNSGVTVKLVPHS